MDGQDFECADDVCFKPSFVACQTDEGVDVVDSCILHGEIWTGNEAVYAWDV